MHVCMLTSVGTHACAGMCVRVLMVVSSRGWCWVSYSSILSIKAVSQLTPSSVDLARQLAQEFHLLLLSTVVAGSLLYSPGVYVTARNLNSGPPACPASYFIYWALSLACHVHFTGSFILEFTWVLLSAKSFWHKNIKLDKYNKYLANNYRNLLLYLFY